MCSLAMSFLFAYYPLLLLWLSAYSLCLVCLYFVPRRGCFIAANLVLSSITAARTATMATSTALRKISIGMAPVVAALAFLLYVLWYIMYNICRIAFILWQALLLSVAAILLAVHALCSIVHIAAMAIYSGRDILWVHALFLLSAAMRHAITIVGAKNTASMFIWVGVFWSIPATADYVDRVMAALLLYLLDALQGYARCAAAIVAFAGSISKIILATMKQITRRRIYEVVAWLCFLLLCIYVAFALIFALCSTVVAAQAMSAMWVSAVTYESISLAAAFAVGLCFWIPFILYCCRHLLLLYMQIVTPIIAAVLVCAGEITMPTYMSLWSMLISYQVCSLVVSGSCTIPLISRIAGIIAMTIMGPGIDLSLSLWCILLVCSYTIVCCMGAILFTIIYPWIIKKNYALRWRRLLLYGGQSYRTILLCFAWLFKPAQYILRASSYAFAFCRSSLLHHL